MTLLYGDESRGGGRVATLWAEGLPSRRPTPETVEGTMCRYKNLTRGE